ncbi:protoheme IX farnesyltransferase [Pseudodesulfovibrio sp. zrk46]|uniref:protoheme IX farnesyltransferase n=1 Tax=Pseudodesulfovibrio sp. zrk46 TaxID=2725288 RepID=UPI001449F742|nr:protoheme IX farnesyltransferase [Pseudodesulfovibrio sp. zrk46]QJB58434.1 protoheme IX farnesyltransferase [Pseudodesulfovibrio sp. zrk46]
MHAVLGLARPRVSLAVAGGSLFGAYYHGVTESWLAVAAALGSFLLCAGCSALNQIQEREQDRRMERTADRPLATGALSVNAALRMALLWMLSGGGLYFIAGGWPLLLLGAAIVAVYNGLYTPLKRVTPMALLAGGFAGAVPPLTGWLAAGGNALDFRILGVTAIFYLWQVPHFWLLAEKHRDDYRRAGFAMLEATLSSHIRSRLMVIWVGAYFVGLGCLAGLAGPASLRWLVPPVLLLAGGGAVLSVLAGRMRFASASMYGSLPLTLCFLLMNTP